MMSIPKLQRRSIQFQHIIVPLDQSSLAEQALPVAARIARASGGSLHLVHVVNVSLDYAWQYGQDSARVSTNMIASSSSRAEAYLKRISSREDLRDLHVKTEVAHGNPAQAILDASRAHDLLVICSHDYTGVARWLQAGVASQLVHESSIPILLLHADEAGSSLTRSHMNRETIRVMIPLDGSSLAEEALEPATELSRLLSSSRQLALHLTSVLPIGEDQPVFERKLAMEQAQLYLSILEQRFLQKEERDGASSITTSVSVSPDIAHTLVELAETGRGAGQATGPVCCDIIAMTTRDRSASARWVMGSIAERVLTTTRLPVFLLHHHPAPPQQDEATHFSSVRKM